MSEGTEHMRGDRVAGVALLAAAAGSIAAMAHHPVGADSRLIFGIIHGTLIALLATMAYGLAHFALRRGLGRPAVLAGLVAYSIGLFADIGAGIINGFIVPALAAQGDGVVGRDIFMLAWEANQVLAQLGVFAKAAAILLWSISLFRIGGMSRWLGLAGLAAGALPGVLLAGGWITMDVTGAFAVYTAHAAWTALAGAWLLWGRVCDEAGA